MLSTQDLQRNKWSVKFEGAILMTHWPKIQQPKSTFGRGCIT